MESKEVKEYLKEAKSKLSFIIKNEVKRKFVGETYSYLIRIPEITFWLVALVTLFAVLTIELLLAGVLIGNETIIYGELLLGFSVAAFIGLVVGKLYSQRVSKKIHAQIGEILKHKGFKEEN